MFRLKNCSENIFKVIFIILDYSNVHSTKTIKIAMVKIDLE